MEMISIATISGSKGLQGLGVAANSKGIALQKPPPAARTESDLHLTKVKSF